MFALLLTSALVLSQKPAPFTPALKAQILDRIGYVLEQKAFVPGTDFSDWSARVRQNQAVLNQATTPRDFSRAVYELLKEYGVSHLALLPPGTGIGAKVHTFGFLPAVYGREWVVDKVYAGTKPDRAGLRPGMIIHALRFMDLEVDVVTVTYSDDKDRIHTVKFPMETFVPRETASLIPMDKDAAVLRVPTFNDGYDQTQIEGLVKRAEKLPYLIVDLRGNSGGRPQFLQHLLGAFLPKGTRVGAAISKQDFQNYARETHKSLTDRAAVVQWAPEKTAITASPFPSPYKGHVALLIDERSASCSEIAAAGLRDCASVPIFGTKSAGMVLLMTRSPLPGGFFLYYPLKDSWTAKGERLEGHPIVPDVTVDPASEEGSALPTPLRKMVLDWLRKKYPAK